MLGAFWESTHVGIVMELCSRGDLKKVLEAGMLIMWKDRLKVLVDIARGMCYLHARDPPIVHRDLKSTNTLVTDHMRAKIADFGTSREATSDATMTLTGTPAWVAPEVWNQQRYDERCDVYSFAIIILEASTNSNFRQMFGTHYKHPQMIAANAVAGRRPDVPGDMDAQQPLLTELMKQCWHSVYALRPHFPEVLEKLEEMLAKETNVGATPSPRRVQRKRAGGVRGPPLSSRFDSSSGDMTGNMMQSLSYDDLRNKFNKVQHDLQAELEKNKSLTLELQLWRNNHPDELESVAAQMVENNVENERKDKMEAWVSEFVTTATSDAFLQNNKTKRTRLDVATDNIDLEIQPCQHATGRGMHRLRCRGKVMAVPSDALDYIRSSYESNRIISTAFDRRVVEQIDHNWRILYERFHLPRPNIARELVWECLDVVMPPEHEYAGMAFSVGNSTHHRRCPVVSESQSQVFASSRSVLANSSNNRLRAELQCSGYMFEPAGVDPASNTTFLLQISVGGFVPPNMITTGLRNRVKYSLGCVVNYFMRMRTSSIDQAQEDMAGLRVGLDTALQELHEVSTSPAHEIETINNIYRDPYSFLTAQHVQASVATCLLDMQLAEEDFYEHSRRVAKALERKQSVEAVSLTLSSSSQHRSLRRQNSLNHYSNSPPATH